MSQRASELQVEAALTAFSVGYRPGNLVGEQLFPVVQHTNETGVYWKWSKAHAFDVVDTLIADGTRPKSVDVQAEKVAFATEEYGVEAKITDRQRKNAANVLGLEQTKVRRAQDATMLDQERRIYRLIRSTCPGEDISGPDKISNPDNTTFETQVDDAKESVRINTGGTEPNVIVIPRNATRHIKRLPAIRELIKYTAPDLLVNGELPPYLWGLRVIVPGAVMNVGTTTTELANIWGDDIVVGYVTQAPEIESPSLGYIVREGDWTVYTYREDPIRTTFYRPTVQQVELITFPEAGYVLRDVI